MFLPLKDEKLPEVHEFLSFRIPFCRVLQSSAEQTCRADIRPPASGGGPAPSWRDLGGARCLLLSLCMSRAPQQGVIQSYGRLASQRFRRICKPTPGGRFIGRRSQTQIWTAPQAPRSRRGMSHPGLRAPAPPRALVWIPLPHVPSAASARSAATSVGAPPPASPSHGSGSVGLSRSTHPRPKAEAGARREKNSRDVPRWIAHREAGA